MLSQSTQDDMNLYLQLKELRTNNQYIVPILSLFENPKYKIYQENLKELFVANDRDAILLAFKLLSLYAMSEHKFLKKYSKEVYNFFETGFKNQDVTIRNHCYETFFQYVCYYQRVSFTFRNLIPALLESIVFFQEIDLKTGTENAREFESALSYLAQFLNSNKSFYKTEYLTIFNGLKTIFEMDQISYNKKKLVINLFYEIHWRNKQLKPSLFIEPILNFIFNAMLSISVDIPEKWTASAEWLRKRYDEDDQLTFNIGEACFQQLFEYFKWENVKELFFTRVQEALSCDWRGIYSVLILCSSIISSFNDDELRVIIYLCQTYSSDSNPKVRLATLYTYHSLLLHSIKQKNYIDAQFILNYMIEQLEIEKNNKLISNILDFIGQQIPVVNLTTQQYSFLVQFIIDQIRKGVPLCTIYSMDLLIYLHKKDPKVLQEKQNEIAELLIQLMEQQIGNMNVSCSVSRFLNLIKYNMNQQ